MNVRTLGQIANLLRLRANAVTRTRETCRTSESILLHLGHIANLSRLQSKTPWGPSRPVASTSTTWSTSTQTANLSPITAIH
jgi:hypothetical protein